MRRLIALILSSSALAACHPAAPKSTRPSHTIHGCSPLALGGDTTGGACVSPFPNAWFEEANAKTTTGLDVSFPDGSLPANNTGTPVTQKTFGLLDGYSPSTPIIVWLPNGVNADQLTKADNIADSLSASNPIVLVDVAAKEKVPFFAEVDANTPNMGRHALLIHPMVRLKFNSRYAVALTTALKDGSGNALQPQGDFALWAQDKLPNSSPLAEIADRLDADAAVFSTLGVAKSSLALAWDFDTASETGTTGLTFGMVSDALQAAPKGLNYKVTSTQKGNDGSTLIQGVFQSPSFENGADPSTINYGPDGKPVMGSPADFPFTALVPACVASQSGPVPLLIIGHGLFGNSFEELQGDDYVLNQLCMVGIGTDFLGVTQSDLLTVVAGKVLTDANNFGLITDRLMQSHVNFQVLTRLAMNALAQDPAFAVNGHPSYDVTQVHYWGASNGGIQGATFLALSPDIDRGLLNVPGAEWSLLIWRSAEFAQASLVFNGSYPDPLDQQVLIGMSQSLWDRTDPIEFVTHIPTSKHVLFQESMGDPLVTNIATEVEMRTLGVKALAPLLKPVYGITDQPGPLDGFVYTQWTVDPSPLPPDTDTPADPNPAHNAIRGLPAAIDQMKQFLQPNGVVVNTCPDQHCEFPGAQ